jgi:TPR repeat protein
MILHQTQGHAMMNFHSLSSSSSRRNQSGNTLLIVVVVVAIAVLAVAGYFFFSKSADEPIRPAAPVPPTAKEAKPDNARSIIDSLKESGDVDYDSAYAQAGEFLRDGQVADAQLLYFFAARGGHGPSALALAGLYDPVGFDPQSGLMDEPDGFQAYKWYGRALEAGESEAAERLMALKEWCEKAAAEGDMAASQLLLQWEQ